MRILITGPTGKVGRSLIPRLLKQKDHEVVAFCHRRDIVSRDGLEVLKGDMRSRKDIVAALQGVTHVVHLATCKEDPNSIIDVSIRGLFWLLEECRKSIEFERLILIGGDSSLGHFFYPHSLPTREEQPRTPYPGCYPLSKVLEEVMLEQYYIQYDLDGCCLRAPWIMEKDDLRYAFSFGEEVFGVPRWRDLVGSKVADRLHREGVVPVMLDPFGNPVRRNVVHVDDLVNAILIALDHPAARQQLFHISMDEPLSYLQVADYLRETRGLSSRTVETPYYSNWMDNSKAKFMLGWRPAFNTERLVDGAWEYQRDPGDPRTVWYPG